MIDTLVFSLWFFLPAGVANGLPPILARLPLIRDWNLPLDFGRSWRGKRLFGEHKTWRGLLGGTAAGALIGILTYYIQPDSMPLQAGADVLGSVAGMAVLGSLLGFGALTGDALESALKRQWNKAAGTSWFPFDQLDYIFGGLAASLLVVRLEPAAYLVITISWFLIHPAASYLAYRVGLKKQPF